MFPVCKEVGCPLTLQVQDKIILAPYPVLAVESVYHYQWYVFDISEVSMVFLFGFSVYLLD